jgi:hypothetical protein
MNAAIVSTTRNPSPAYINNMLVANVESMLNSFASMATIALTGPYSGFIVGFPLVVAAHYAAPLVAKLMTDPTGKLAAKSSREPTVPKAPPEPPEPPAKSAGAASPRIIPLEKRLLPRED